ncbi:DNA mismatch repair protein MutS [Thiopseudomonas alkaliphila]|uniref:DNA mismatch repair protein MutS n=1 Tax=Thiopseudomonas alkaliphila TaxID=1697053 RepID=A0A0K1XCT8_9GAMM|nr:Smr/MutS family protein [Thiopseudomonas alkaliphila]AKX44518.1 DNA mismatch repair protein MutS [Thiopseudomonas alkaliphila]AKX46707.1 DNA mismatch repair protein MutS [Thiopseudomonas alkaliphila]AKX49811.1 DNA mismatch repair protein MutS [Thiopseudomonas alkaliphila]AKX52300.1 DNA mismatch repair protein MutS [Thiopseudomonas alkaliphila]AKX59008.1 DNA mismatch repair protein MutS [Thiopseudomonas alkaliphila]
MSDDDFSLFAEQMQGVRRIKVDQADTGKAKQDRQNIQLNRQRALTATEVTVVDGLSDQFILDVTPEEELFWKREGVQDAQIRRLKAGLIPFEGGIDLHGMRVEQARTLLWDFLAEAKQFEVRCVRITHGKAAKLDGSKPMLKSHVNTWLRQHPQVLAFCSCQAKHGGAGAVYVLLKRNMMDGREESLL